MKFSAVIRLFAAVCLFLGSIVVPAQAADPAYFEALKLTVFANPANLPDVNMPDLTGQNVNLQSLRGKVLLLNFWTTF